MKAKRKNKILVVECKFINQTNRTKKRKKVRDQALLYASWAKVKNASYRVRGCWYTNETEGYTEWLTYEVAMGVVPDRGYLLKIDIRFVFFV